VIVNFNQLAVELMITQETIQDIHTIRDSKWEKIIALNVTLKNM